MARARDKTSTNGLMCPTEQTERSLNALMFLEREGCADWAEYIAEEVGVKTCNFFSKGIHKTEETYQEAELKFFDTENVVSHEIKSSVKERVYIIDFGASLQLVGSTLPTV